MSNFLARRNCSRSLSSCFGSKTSAKFWRNSARACFWLGLRSSKCPLIFLLNSCYLALSMRF
ncbi:hypothetical protein X975_04350, partial [Stegodyphus mimosarum]